MKILHLSDLHFCTSFKRENIAKTKKILRRAIQESFDHLVITGDISDNSNANDYEILKAMLKNFGLYSSEKTSIVIGNHDIFGGVQTVFDVLNFPKKCSLTNYKGKLDEFYQAFNDLFQNVKFPSNESPFPFLKQIDNVLFIGMNSIAEYSKIKNPFASNGKIKKEQLFELSKELKKEKYQILKKVLLVHHHFYKNNEYAKSSNSTWNKIENFTLKLRGKKKVFRFLNDNDIRLVLHGHSHENRIYERKGIQFVNAGAAIDNFSKGAYYYLIEENSGGYSLKLNVIIPPDSNDLKQVENVQLLQEFAK